MKWLEWIYLCLTVAMVAFVIGFGIGLAAGRAHAECFPSSHIGACVGTVRIAPNSKEDCRVYCNRVLVRELTDEERKIYLQCFARYGCD